MKRRLRFRSALSQALRQLWPKSTLGRTDVVVLGGTLIVASVPVLLFALIVGGHIAGGLWGAVNVFNSPFSPPGASEMVGTYSLKPKSAELIVQFSSATVQVSTIRLYADRTVQLQNVYEYVASDSDQHAALCRISGKGLWTLTSFDAVRLSVHLDPSASIQGGKLCAADAWLTYAVLGRGRPHRLWSYIGDPDNDTGLEYAP